MSRKLVTNPTATQRIETLVVDQPVRSGQQVYSRGDLIVLAPVSTGAELMAEGNIHVYSKLRGRALAGVRGDGEDSRGAPEVPC